MFREAAAAVAADPEIFPIRHPVGLLIMWSEPPPDPWPDHGYTTETAMIEVLVDAGLIDGEHLGESVRWQIRPEMSGYSIYIEESHLGGYSIGPSSPSPRAD